VCHVASCVERLRSSIAQETNAPIGHCGKVCKGLFNRSRFRAATQEAAVADSSYPILLPLQHEFTAGQ
jgi:hypothetical protein